MTLGLLPNFVNTAALRYFYEVARYGSFRLAADRPVTHVRLDIVPDGGLKGNGRSLDDLHARPVRVRICDTR